MMCAIVMSCSDTVIVYRNCQAWFQILKDYSNPAVPACNTFFV